MPAEPNHALPTARLQEWQAESVRVTLFRVNPGPPPQDARDWWSGIVGEPPATRTESPRESAWVDTGPVKEGVLSLRVDPHRIDWVYTGSSERPDVLQSAGTVEEAVGYFFGALRAWLDKAPPATRVALGLTSALPVADRVEGYRRLQAYLPAVQIDPASEDFFYQVNRPRRSGVHDGLRINRLSRWSVMAMQRLTMALTKSGTPSMQSDDSRFSLRAELDINSDAQFNGALRVPVVRLLEEFAKIAFETIRTGDR